jgi:hypothetical protein
MGTEKLSDLIKPERLNQIKEDQIKRSGNATKSPYLIDILKISEEEGCAACFL